jgi:hypothetical protein
MNMQELIANFVRDVRLVAIHEAKKELITQIANRTPEPIPAKEFVKKKRAPAGDYGKPEPAKILQAIREGFTNGRHIAAKYGWNQATTAVYMRKMEAQGLIGRTGMKQTTRWFSKTG